MLSRNWRKCSRNRQKGDLKNLTEKKNMKKIFDLEKRRLRKVIIIMLRFLRLYEQ